MAFAKFGAVANYSKPLAGDTLAVSAGEVVARTASVELAAGDGSGEADAGYSRGGTLAASTPLDLDLTALPSAAGTVNLAAVKGLYARNLSATHPLTLDTTVANGWRAATGGAGGKITIPAGGFASLCAPGAGWAVTAGTGDILRLDPGSNPVAYEIVLAGVSA